MKKRDNNFKRHVIWMNEAFIWWRNQPEVRKIIEAHFKPCVRRPNGKIISERIEL